MKLYITLFFIILNSVNLYSQTEIAVPKFNDKYSDYVKQLESGNTNIDYKDFRYSFIESEQFKIASIKSSEIDDLKKVMYTQMDKSNYSEVIKITKKILSIDYTNLTAHKILRQTYKIVNDTANAEKYKTIQFGLLNSIIKSGDGKSCDTAWPVIQVSEEYFILQMLDAELQQQSIDNSGGICDKMSTLVDNQKVTYYFETTKVFEGYKKLGM